MVLRATRVLLDKPKQQRFPVGRGWLFQTEPAVVSVKSRNIFLTEHSIVVTSPIDGQPENKPHFKMTIRRQRAESPAWFFRLSKNGTLNEGAATARHHLFSSGA